MTTERRCTFCGHHENDVQKLIAGNDVLICDRCVKTCAQNFSGGSSWDAAARTWIEHPPLSPWPRRRQSHFGDDVSCAFCGAAEPDRQWLVGCRRPNTFICDECVGVCLEILQEPPTQPGTMNGRAKRAGLRGIRWPWQAKHLDKATAL